MNLREWKSMTPGEWACNLALYAIGVGIMPMGVVLTINAHLGAGGYDALNFALAERLHINTSLAIYATAFLVVLLAAFIRKGYPRLETFISSFFLGIFTDMWKTILAPVQGTGLAASLLIMAAGAAAVAFAVACYIISVFPTNPSDDLVVDLYERGMNLGPAKVFLDAVCVVLAFFCGEIGIGTIVCTFGLDPVIDMFHGRIRGKICVWLENGKVGKWFENRRNSVHLFFDSLYLRRNSSCASSSASLS